MAELTEALARSEHSSEQFRVLAELSSDYTYVARVADGSETVTWLTGAYARIAGFDEGAPNSDTPWTRCHPEDRHAVQDAIERARRGERVSHEFRLVTVAGSVLWIREQLRPTVAMSPAGAPRVDIFGAAREVTDRQLARDEQAHLEAQLRQSQKMEAVGRLAGGVAHDFNNLLTVILTHCGFLLSDLPANTQLHDDASDIQAAARRAAELTQRLLAFSRQQVLTPVVLELNSVLRDLEPVLTSLLGEDIESFISLHTGLVHVRADRAQLEQILLNLVVNSRDAMPNGGKLEIATDLVNIAAEDSRTHDGVEPGPHVRLLVRDTGTGMSDDVLARVFEPFFTTKEQGKGTGLGLSTVYGIVKQSRGSIRVESKVGFGTLFEVFFPAVAAEAQREANALRSSQERSTRNETILVVEDEEGVRRGVQRILRHAGYTVLVAADPAQALALVEEYAAPIPLLLTDVVMPMMSGVELAERIRALRPETKVLFMSGHARDGLDAEAAVRHLEFLQKPFTRQSLLAKVESVLSELCALAGSHASP